MEPKTRASVAFSGAWLADLAMYLALCAGAIWRAGLLPLPGSIGAASMV